MNRFKPWPALLILLLTQGCGGILTSDQPARQHYLLQPLDAASAGPGEADLALQVTAIPGLDTDQVLALGTDARLQQVSNARWTDHLPEVLTSTLQRSLESSGRFAAVRATDRAAADGWRLQLEAREFYGILDAAGNTSSVRVASSADVPSRRAWNTEPLVLVKNSWLREMTSASGPLSGVKSIWNEPWRAMQFGNSGGSW